VEYIQVAKLKTNFSDILQSIQNSGKSYIIEYGKNRKKVAMIIPYDRELEKQSERKFGILKDRGSFKIKKDFSISDEELLGL